MSKFSLSFSIPAKDLVRILRINLCFPCITFSSRCFYCWRIFSALNESTAAWFFSIRQIPHWSVDIYCFSFAYWRARLGKRLQFSYKFLLQYLLVTNWNQIDTTRCISTEFSGRDFVGGMKKTIHFYFVVYFIYLLPYRLLYFYAEKLRSENSNNWVSGFIISIKWNIIETDRRIQTDVLVSASHWNLSEFYRTTWNSSNHIADVANCRSQFWSSTIRLFCAVLVYLVRKLAQNSLIVVNQNWERQSATSAIWLLEFQVVL